MSDIIYYNLEINTGSQGLYSTYNGQQNASIQAQNYLPILEKPSDYYCSIVRLSVPEMLIPIAYFDVAINQDGLVIDPNVGVYTFKLAFGTNNILKNVSI